MKTMPSLFWLHLPNEARLGPTTDGDPIITERLIDPGNSLRVCVWGGERAEASHIRHAYNVQWSQVNAPTPLKTPLPA